MPGSDFIRLVFSKRTCYRVYAILALLTRLLIRVIAWVLEVHLDLDSHTKLSIRAETDQEVVACTGVRALGKVGHHGRRASLLRWSLSQTLPAPCSFLPGHRLDVSYACFNSLSGLSYDISTTIRDSSPRILQDKCMPRQQLLQVGMDHQHIRLCCKPGKPLLSSVSLSAKLIRLVLACTPTTISKSLLTAVDAGWRVSGNTKHSCACCQRTHIHNCRICCA